MVNDDTYKLPLKKQVLYGLAKGTVFLHAIPSGLINIIEDLKDPEIRKPTLLENISMGGAILAGGYLYYASKKYGFPLPVWFLPILTNVGDLITGTGYSTCLWTTPVSTLPLR